LKENHRLHHRYNFKRLNVVLPLAQIVLRNM
jgi:hypothetical protein